MYNADCPNVYQKHNDYNDFVTKPVIINVLLTLGNNTQKGDIVFHICSCTDLI